jgi:hypothetical protein
MPSFDVNTAQCWSEASRMKLDFGRNGPRTFELLGMIADDCLVLPLGTNLLSVLALVTAVGKCPRCYR